MSDWILNCGRPASYRRWQQIAIGRCINLLQRLYAMPRLTSMTLQLLFFSRLTRCTGNASVRRLAARESIVSANTVPPAGNSVQDASETEDSSRRDKMSRFMQRHDQCYGKRQYDVQCGQYQRRGSLNARSYRRSEQAGHGCRRTERECQPEKEQQVEDCRGERHARGDDSLKQDRSTRQIAREPQPVGQQSIFGHFCVDPRRSQHHAGD